MPTSSLKRTTKIPSEIPKGFFIDKIKLSVEDELCEFNGINNLAVLINTHIA